MLISAIYTILFTASKAKNLVKDILLRQNQITYFDIASRIFIEFKVCDDFALLAAASSLSVCAIILRTFASDSIALKCLFCAINNLLSQ
jgi:hypothetical protein